MSFDINDPGDSINIGGEKYINVKLIYVLFDKYAKSREKAEATMKEKDTSVFFHAILHEAKARYTEILNDLIYLTT